LIFLLYEPIIRKFANNHPEDSYPNCYNSGRYRNRRGGKWALKGPVSSADESSLGIQLVDGSFDIRFVDGSFGIQFAVDSFGIQLAGDSFGTQLAGDSFGIRLAGDSFDIRLVDGSFGNQLQLLTGGDNNFEQWVELGNSSEQLVVDNNFQRQLLLLVVELLLQPRYVHNNQPGRLVERNNFEPVVDNNFAQLL